MRRGSICIFLLWVASSAWPASAPVAILMPASFEARSDPEARAKGGLLVSWLEAGANKKSAVQIARFNADLEDAGFTARLSRVLACIGAEAVSDTCQTATVLDASTNDLPGQLKSLGSDRALVVRIHPLKTDVRIRMRAVVNDIRVDAPDKPLRMFTAVYETRVPASLEAQLKSDPAKVAAWWSEGSPSRLQIEVDKGMEELRQMLTLLDSEVLPGTSAPAGWTELPKMDALTKAGRIKCGGGVCRTQRVLRDFGNRTWLVSIYPQGATLYGWSIASLDDATSSRYANLLLNVQTSD